MTAIAAGGSFNMKSYKAVYRECPKVSKASTQHSLQSIIKTLGYSPLVQDAFGKSTRAA